MADPTYDVLIVGGGQAGVPLAHALAYPARRVALAERRHLGGSCVNFGCTPTKAAIASARLAHRARQGDAFGLRIPTVEVDFAAVMARCRDLARSFRSGLEDGFADADNPQILEGHARFTGRDGDGFTLRVGEQELRAQQVVIDTGTRTRMPPLDGLDAVDVLHGGNWLYHDDQPRHLILLGGSYVGLEMSQLYRRLGSDVTVVEQSARPTLREDEDVAEAMQDFLEEEGVRFRFGATARHVTADADGVTVAIEEEDGSTDELRGTHLFVATGRRPNTDDLGLDAIGLTTDDRGFLDVDERLATRVEGVWAAGDVRGGPMFTHTAWDDHRILKSQLTGDGRRTTDRVVPYAIFTDPQLGRVGMTEQQAREAGRDVRVVRKAMETNGKALESGDARGFVKVVVDAETDRLLGAAVLASLGAEIVHPYVTLMNADAPFTALYDGMHIHPTFSEAVHSVLGDV